MSLFNWSTPKRCKAGQLLPIIPNELYLHIFGYVAPPTGRLTPEELETFTNLSRVCRFFANFCLPRIFEFVEFSGAISPSRDTPRRRNGTYKTSREATLCDQIAAKQPLALALAERVAICHFKDWKLGHTASWAVRLFSDHYIAGMSHMKNIRELSFTNSFVAVEHWLVIAALSSLEELSFTHCDFLRVPEAAYNVESGPVKAKVSRLQVNKCMGYYCHPIKFVDPRCLRTLAIDHLFYVGMDPDESLPYPATLSNKLDWLSQSALTELRVHDLDLEDLSDVHTILMHVPESVEVLWLSVFFETEEDRAESGFWSMLDERVRKNLPLLRSLTLRLTLDDSTLPENVTFFFLDCIASLADLVQSFTLHVVCPIARVSKISSSDVLRILHDKLGAASRLSCVTIDGVGFRLLDGEWKEVFHVDTT